VAEYRDRAARWPMVLGLEEREDLSRLLVHETPMLHPHNVESSRQSHALEVGLGARAVRPWANAGRQVM